MNISDRINNEIRIIKARITKQKCVVSKSKITTDLAFDLMFLHRIKNIIHTANNYNISTTDLITEIDILIDNQFKNNTI